MPQSNDLSRCLISFRQDETLVAVVEMSKTSWLVAGMIPGVARHPLKKLVPDEKALFELLERWRDEAVKAGKIITRITVAYEAGRDGFWLARWLRARGFEVYVVHSSSVAVTREHRRAKTDRLDCEMLKRVFIGWLRGERDHCRMVAIATQTQEDAKRPNRERENLVGECTRIVGRLKAGLARLGIRSFNPKLRNAAERLKSLRTPEDVPVPANTLCELRRDMARLRFVEDQIKQIERARVRQLEQAPEQGPQQMVRHVAAQLAKRVRWHRHVLRRTQQLETLRRIAQFWIEAPDAETGQTGFQPAHDACALADQVLALAVRALGILLRLRLQSRPCDDRSRSPRSQPINTRLSISQ